MDSLKHQINMIKPNINLTTQELGTSKMVLTNLLANSFVLYLKTHSFHWNVEGDQALEYHELFEVQYREIWEAIDIIAERLRMIGFYAPASSKELMHTSEIVEDGNILQAKNMIEVLHADHQTIIKSIRDGLKQMSSNSSFDEGTIELLKARLASHEKTAWILRALLS